MNIWRTVLIALVVGFVAGLLLSEGIAIIAHFVFDRAIGIKYLPFIIAAVFAGVALIWGNRSRSAGFKK
ncbi:MAG: hypothetical protein K0R67_2349 [Paenibacillus sp.]|nr:hypothetical protein [Paenibacillus sp.]